MALLIYILIAVIALLVVYSAALVTYHTARSAYFEKKQKIIIIAIAWFIPLIGPAFILTVLNEDKPRIRKPGIPLFDLIFLSAVFTQDANSSSESAPMSEHGVSSFGGGDGSGDT